jgi:NAD(P)-dependent dehydrogenase (short-subunit alcohol dehydrogenase family)
MTNEQITALVTGANRGLGKRFAAQLVERGAKVYAAARRPQTVDVPGVEPVQLDITDPTSVRRAAALAGDVTVLINNAGVATHASLITGPMDDVRLEMETHYFGTLIVTRAFAPIIEGKGGGAILSVLSVLSWRHSPVFGGYSAAKAAEWAMTDALRQELAPRGTHVAALHVGYMDTDMAAFAPAEQKVDPTGVAKLALDGLLAGEPEILAERPVARGEGATSRQSERLTCRISVGARRMRSPTVDDHQGGCDEISPQAMSMGDLLKAVLSNFT